MVTCESCGNQTNSLIKVRILGSNMNVCNNCKSLGEVLENDNSNISHSFRKKSKSELNNLGVVSNYSSIINSILAKKKLNFHNLAKATNIKESSLTKYLSGKIHLDVDTARKIEHFLEIKLVEEIANVNVENFLEDEKESSTLSLGDLLKKQLNK